MSQEDLKEDSNNEKAESVKSLENYFDPEKGFANREMIDNFYSALYDAKSVSEVMVALIELSQNKVKYYLSNNKKVIEIEKLFAIVKSLDIENIEDDILAETVNGLPEHSEVENTLPPVIIEGNERFESARCASAEQVEDFYTKLESVTTNDDVMNVLLELATDGVDVYKDADGLTLEIDNLLPNVKGLHIGQVKDTRIADKLREINPE